MAIISLLRYAMATDRSSIRLAESLSYVQIMVRTLSFTRLVAFYQAPACLIILSARWLVVYVRGILNPSLNVGDYNGWIL